MKNLFTAAISVALIALIAFFILGNSPTGSSTEPKGGFGELLSQGPLEVGDTAPDFELTDMNGERIRLSDYEGAPAMLIFFSPSCGACAMKIREMRNMYEKNGAKGSMLLISIDKNTNEELRDFQEVYGSKEWEWATDTENLFFKYGIKDTYHVFILDKNLKIEKIVFSERDPSVENFLEI